MTELLDKDFEMIFPETLQHTYNIKNQYEFGLNKKYKTYNEDMENDIVFLNHNYENYQEIERYFNKIAKKFDAIQIDKKKLSGMPVIKDTRIPVSLVAACLKDEMTIQDICEEYRLTKQDVETAMEYVIEILDVHYQEG